MTRLKQAALTVAVAIVPAACGNEVPLAPPGSSGQQLIILNYAFDPPSLEVTSGSTVLVQNQDSQRHTVTSELAPGAFTPDGRIISPPIAGFIGISVPPGLAPGTVIPIYCQFHLEQGEFVVTGP